MSQTAPELPWAFNHALELYRSGAEFDKLGPVLQQARRDVEELTEMAVDRAAQRETWEAIGSALGVSRQAARKKYGAASPADRPPAALVSAGTSGAPGSCRRGG